MRTRRSDSDAKVKSLRKRWLKWLAALSEARLPAGLCWAGGPEHSPT